MKKLCCIAVIALMLILLPTMAQSADPANFANPAEKIVATPFIQAAGVVADVPGVFVRGGDRVNQEYNQWYSGIMADTSAAHRRDLIEAYKSYRKAVAATVTDYNATRKKTRYDKMAHDQKLVIANRWFKDMVGAAQIRNKYTPKFKYDSPGMMAQVAWGAVKGGLNYDWQQVDRALGILANVATAPANNKNYAPGVWESGPIHKKMWENDVANVAKLGGAIACPIAAYQGVTIAGQAPHTAAAAMGLTATCAHGAQVFFMALDQANKELGIVK